MPNLQDDAALEAAKTRYREFERRIGVGCGHVLMMAAGDSLEMKRAAWRARNDLRNHRKKNSLGRIVLDDVPHDPFIRTMIELGLYTRPRASAPTFDGAVRAFEAWILSMIATDGDTRVTMEKLYSRPPGEKVITTQEDHDSEFHEPKNQISAAFRR